MRTLPPLLTLALLGACAGPDRALKSFDSCEALQGTMQRMAARELRDGSSFDLRLASTEFAMADSEGGSAPQAPAHSTTNVQEQGVDEADLVKSDGTYLYALAGKNLVTTRAWPIEDAEVLSVLPLDGTPRGLYLLEDPARAVVISDLWWGQSPAPLSGESPVWRAGTTPSAVVTIVDLSDREAPVIERQTYVTGALKTTRRIDDALYVVTYEDVTVAEATGGSRRAERAAVWNAPAAQWQARRFDNRLATRGDTPTWEVEVGPACDCDETYYSDDLGGTYLTSVLVLDLADPLSAFDGTAVVGRADTVYMSPGAVYVAYNEVDSGPFTSFDDILETVVHRFSVGGERPTYDATGVIRGVVDDLFSLSEKDGFLRLATTDLGRQRSADDASSGVYVLEAQDGVLEPVSWVTGLAPGEQITSARFVGDVGFIATWEVILGDPLFTFDLSDPYDIRLGGALEVTGWSDYLHPMADGRLLGIGIENNDDGTAWGDVAVSLYDVSDLSDPRMVEREVLQAWGSEAQSDHHAFNYFATTGTLTIPSWATQGETVLEVLTATPDGIEPVGRVVQPSSLTGGSSWCSGIRRSVVIGEDVWAVSNTGMTAAPLSAPGTILRSLPFSGFDPCEATDYWDRGF